VVAQEASQHHTSSRVRSQRARRASEDELIAEKRISILAGALGERRVWRRKGYLQASLRIALGVWHQRGENDALQLASASNFALAIGGKKKKKSGGVAPSATTISGSNAGIDINAISELNWWCWNVSAWFSDNIWAAAKISAASKSLSGEQHGRALGAGLLDAARGVASSRR